MDRPRRSTRQLPKEAKRTESEVSNTATRKKPDTRNVVDPAELLKMYLESPKSPLTKCDMTDTINPATWEMLSDDARAHLKTLLPRTAFSDYHESLGQTHPGAGLLPTQDATTPSLQSEKQLNPAIFADGHFLAASRSFQDHLCSNWFSEKHIEKVTKFMTGIETNTLSAPWKDEEWERQHPTLQETPQGGPVLPTPSNTLGGSQVSGPVGGASQIKLTTLAKVGVVKVGDIVAYRRLFPSSITIEKDCIIQSIHPKTQALTVIAVPGPIKELPSHFLSPNGSDMAVDDAHARSIIITSPTMLETALLDLDGRIMDQSARPNTNTWKCFTIWRFRGHSELNPYDSRGGRDNHGTLFYLRGSYYHESYVATT